ncbi:uncharacterized protein [Parasteatoda tepidariorum]|uniref:uncharacterized protein n=1 Tax=Parasteatoda tepidariorum TaxID=114398 RepID=UPI00077FBF6F|nr:uncharacterized protein LOC107452675 [Parasteatoda tepidariorum]
MKTILLFLYFKVLFFHTFAYTYLSVTHLNTDNGYCEIDGARIAVGERSYDYIGCRMLRCEVGQLHISGCSAMQPSQPWCHLVRGEGYFPKCCPHIEKCKIMNYVVGKMNNGIQNTNSVIGKVKEEICKKDKNRM